MGCAGSKPHHLLASSMSNHHANSPQKGFILFNDKTIEYLNANELDIKKKLLQRCETRLNSSNSAKTGSIPQSKSLLSNAKRTLLMSDSSKQNNKSDFTLSSSTEANSSKELAIESAVEFVLKYAINDFDIDNFKSSNQLSMKQIRKDIMKKHSSSRVSSSKLNSSVSASSNANTLSSKDATLSSGKQFDMAYYKLALNTAIDEFGSFIQENFIVINEFDREKEAKLNADAAKSNEADKAAQNQADHQSEVSEEEALKLKEAIELARQNFYKGKLSMVCLTKTGGYVVKEVNEKENSIPEGLLVPQAQLEPKKEAVGGDQAAVEEFLRVKSELSALLVETVESIVNYSTKSSIFNEAELNSDNLKSFSAYIDSLKENLEKSKNVIEILNIINEKDYNLIDEKLIESALNLDYVNREFKSYIKHLEDTLNQLVKKTDDNKELVESVLLKNAEIRLCVEQLDKLIEQLPRKLFTSKGLPHPADANQSASISTVNTLNMSKDLEAMLINYEKEVKQDVAEAKEPEAEPAKVEPVEEETKKGIDIKKEIAFSILNVGEVIAKTIDYYSLDPKEGHAEELKELITLSEKQAELEKKHADSAEKQLEVVTTENKQQEAQLQLPVSSASSLSSPSLASSSPLSASGSISPVEKLTQPEFNAKMDASEESKRLSSQGLLNESRQEYELIEKVKSAGVEPKESVVSEEVAYLVAEMSTSMSNYLNGPAKDENELNGEGAKSSSSSSDILNSNLEETNAVQQFITSVIDTAAKRLSSELDESTQGVVFRNNGPKSEDKTETTNKRMSLEEELFYQLEEVDKKVKYMNETCSENEEEDDEDLDDENFDYDESVELENTNDERLFHPRTPAKIKSDLRQNRQIDLHEEIKAISNVIQDLVQTINVRNSSNNGSALDLNELNGNGDEKNVILSSFEDNNSDKNDADSEDGCSQNSGSGGDCKTKVKFSGQRRSYNGASANNSFSSIPVRQKVLTKQKATDDELANGNESMPSTPDKLNKSGSSQKFRSKLPVKK